MCPLCPCAGFCIANVLHQCHMFVAQLFFRDAGSTAMRQSQDWSLSLSGRKHQGRRAVGQGEMHGCFPCCGAVEVQPRMGLNNTRGCVLFWGGTSLICIIPLINSGEAARLNLALLRGGEAGP